MQARIDRLEGLVLRLMGSGGNHVSPSTDRERSVSTDNGTNKSKRYDDDDVGMGSIHGDEKHRNEGESDGDVEEVRSALGIMKVDQGKSYYRGGTHWAAILSEVRAGVAHYFLVSGVSHQIILERAHQASESKFTSFNGADFVNWLRGRSEFGFDAWEWNMASISLYLRLTSSITDI